MWLSSLRKALRNRRENCRIARLINEGKNIKNISVGEIKVKESFNLDQSWWLENLFGKLHLSFVQGVFLIYFIVETVRIIFVLFMVGNSSEQAIIAYLTPVLGELFIPISLIIANSVYKASRDLNRHMNDLLLEKRLVAPPNLISKKERGSEKDLNDLDEQYRTRYISPIAFRSLNDGLSLSFDKNYQLGSGVITVVAYLIIVAMRYYFHIISPHVFTITLPGIPQTDFYFLLYGIFQIGFDWFWVGALTWTLFVSFLVVVQASGNTIRVRPFESIKHYFEPVTTLAFRLFYMLTFWVTWLSPLFLVWTILPETADIVMSFVVPMLGVTIPIIILSVAFPVLKIHKGMEDTRKRALILKRQQLEDVKKIREAYLGKYFMIQEHLINDYKDIQGNSEWVLDISQALQIAGTVLLPVFTFVLSLALG